MLNAGMDNLNLDKESEEVEKDEGDDKQSKKKPQSKHESQSFQNHRQEWIKQMHHMRLFGTTVPWLDEEVPDLVFDDEAGCLDTADHKSRANSPRGVGRGKFCHTSYHILSICGCVCCIDLVANWEVGSYNHI